MSPPEGRELAPSIRELAAAVGDLATAPGDRATRRRAADRALTLARSAAASPPRSQATLTASAAIRMVAADIVAFAGVDPGQAADVVREGTGDLDVPEPPPAPRTPFRTDRR